MITNFKTKRLYLRTMIISDSESLFKIWSDSEVTEFMNITPFTDEQQAKEMITFLEELTGENKAIRYSIVELQSNDIIGSCGYNTLDFDNAKAEIGYDIAKECWGKGYATEAITVLINIAFTELNLNRVEAKVEPENIRSIKLLQKLNFALEGTLRQYEKSKEGFIDLHMFSKLAID